MQQPEMFRSRWGLFLAVLGMAIGAGNIWRFPRVAAENGGGTFLVAWIVVLFLWSIPLIMAEFAMGRHARMGVVGAFAKLIGRRFAWMGAFVGVCTLGIMFYYSVVAGWSARYFVQAVSGGLGGVDHRQAWEAYTASGFGPILYHFLALAMASFVIYRGVSRGIERANRILIPMLFLLLIAAAIRALTLPGAAAGVEYLFHFDSARIFDHTIWLEALSQSAWSTGAGWGLIITYAVYMRESEDIVLNSFLTGLGNNSASLIAALAVIPTVFALSVSQEAAEAALGEGNTGLAFIVIPQLFEQMPGSRFFASLFFLALSVAALTSLISMVELGTRIGMDFGLTRRKALSVVATGGLLLGIPSALWLGFFNNQDWVWGIGLLISGAFVAFAAGTYGIRRFRENLVNGPWNDINVGRWFEWAIRYLIPVEFAGMLAWWFYQSATVYDKQGWWNPLHVYSVGTCIAQWAAVLTTLLLLNRWLVRMTLPEESD